MFRKMQELMYIDTNTINPLPSDTSDNPGTEKPQERCMPVARPLLDTPFSGPPQTKKHLGFGNRKF